MGSQKQHRSDRSGTPPALNSIGVREFMRGGIYNLKQPTTVMSHSDEMGVWLPRGQYEALLSANGTYYASSTSTLSPTITGDVLTSSVLRGTTSSAVNVDALNDAVAKLHQYLERLPETGDKEDK